MEHPAESPPTELPPTNAPDPHAFQRLDVRAIPYDATTRWIRIGVLSIVLLVLATLMFTLGWLTDTWRALALGLGLLFLAVEVVCAFVMPRLHHKHTSYRVDEQGLEIRSGVLWRSIVTVARSRVQHLDVTQGPIERNYGLGRLHVHTAGTSDATITLWGVAHEQATALRDDLGHWSSDADGV